MTSPSVDVQDQRWHWRLRTLLAQSLPPAVLLGLFVLGWQLLAYHYRFVLPQIGAIWHQLVSQPGTFVRAAGVTLEEAAVGLGASLVVSFALAVLMTYSKLAERAIMPLAVVLSVTPIVAIAPAINISLGVGLAPRFLVTALIVFFPLLVNALMGLKSADPEALRYFKTLHATRREVLFKLRVPASLPFLFTAARIAFPLALVGAVVSEWSASGSDNGLGSLILNADLTSQWSTTYAAVLWLCALGLVFTVAVILAERKLLFWHPSGSSPR